MSDLRSDPRVRRARREKAVIGVTGLAIGAAIITFALFLHGCGAAPSPAQQAAVQANLAAQTACVYEAGAGLPDAAAKRASIDDCRCAVKAQYGAPCPDSGVPQ
jgi:hypothetical protein